MTGWVIDASVTIAWCFKEEASPETDAIARRVRDEGAIVPSLWHWEVANVLCQAERCGRILVATVADRLASLAELPIGTDDSDRDRAWHETLALARAERLTVYDAAYLELALRTGKTLASRDGDLVAAARRLGVVALP